MDLRNEHLRTETWKVESSRYLARIDKLKNTKDDINRGAIQKLPSIPLEYLPSSEGLIALNIVLYTITCLNLSLNSLNAFVILWEKCLLSSLSVHARQIYELWGATHYAYQLLLEMHISENPKKVDRRVVRLLHGARSEVQMPWGGLTKEQSIHVMDLIRSLKDVYPETETTYGFLCESCHPNYFRLMEWFIGGPPFYNWDNKAFNRNGHNLIDQTLRTMEQALSGIVSDTNKSLEIAIPYIQADLNASSNVLDSQQETH